MEHEVALKQNWQKIIDCCGEDYIGEKVKILAKRRDEDYDCKPDVSVYKLFPANALPYYVSEEYMATYAAIDTIIDNINSYSKIKKDLGRDGIELAEKIRTAAVEKRRSLSGISNSIVVSEIEHDSQTRVVIWDYDSSEIIDVVRIRSDYKGTETLEDFVKRLYAVSPLINIYCIETRREVSEKFGRYGFINTYNDLNEIDDKEIRTMIIKSQRSLFAKIAKRQWSCKELDKCFPFV